MIELHPFLQVLLAGLFLGLFAIASIKNSSEEDDEDDDESQQARDDDV